MSLEKKSSPETSRLGGIAVMILSTIAVYVVGWLIATDKLYHYYDLDWYALRFFLPSILEILPIVFYVLWFNKANSFYILGTNKAELCADFINPSSTNGVYTKSNKILYTILSVVLPIITCFVVCLLSNQRMYYWLGGETTPLHIDQGVLCVLQGIINIIVFSLMTPFKSK